MYLEPDFLSMGNRMIFLVNNILRKCAHAVRMKPKIMAKKELSIFGGSSEQHGSLRVAADSLCQDLSANNLTSTVPSTTSAAIDEDKESCQDDRAIDTDSTDWEDSNEGENSKSGVGGTMLFQRIPLKLNSAPQRQSLITLALQSMQHHGLTPRSGHMIPKSISTDVHPERALLSPMTVSSSESDEAPIRIRQKPSGTPTQSLNDAVRSSAQPIPLTSNGVNEPVVFSPRTTRRNMVATELTEWLGRQLLWEKIEKTLTANAVLKRRYTYGDATTLGQYPQRSYADEDSSDIDACSWDQDFIREAFAGYHSRGW